MAKVGKSVSALVVVDNTFATPINQNPLALGADLVLHSATKFLGGHADALGGVVCGNKELVEQIYHYREINGANACPLGCLPAVKRNENLKAPRPETGRKRDEDCEIPANAGDGGSSILSGP